MEDALDLIGWYSHKIRCRIGIHRNDAYRLYFACHEGQDVLDFTRMGSGWSSPGDILIAPRITGP